MAKKNPKLDALRNLANHDPDLDKNSQIIPSGHSELDFYISRGLYEDEHGQTIEYDEEVLYGFPSGKLAMLYGGEGCGKSSLAYRIGGNAQQMGRVVFWIDAENSFSPQLAKINGLDPDQIAIQRLFDTNDPDKIFDAETILDIVMDACKKGAGVVVLDSVASLVPKYVMDNPTEKDTVAVLARVLGKSLSKIAGYAAANDTLVIFLNQLRVNPGQMFGNPEGTTGGNALRHFVSITLKMNKLSSKEAYHYVQDDEGSETLIAGSTNVWIEKNRFASPHREAVKIPIYYRYYFPDAEEIIFDYGRKTRVISVRKGVYSWNDIKVEGREDFMSAVKASDAIGGLVEAIREAAVEKGIPIPPEVVNYEKHVQFGQNNEVQQGKEPPDFDPDKEAPKRKQTKKKTSRMPKVTAGSNDEAEI